MLRFKPTRVTLTEDDLCYHIDSIFSRNDQLTKWHYQRTGSGNSYDGDDDEDGLFYDSDSFSVPETYYESECDETQSQQLTGGNIQETDSGSRSNNTSTGTNSGSNISSTHSYRHSVSVRFALPESAPLTPDSNSVTVVSSGIVQHATESARTTHPRPPIPLPFIVKTDLSRLRSTIAPQHNHLNPSLLTLRSLRSSQPTEAVVLNANLARLLSSIVALPVRISGREENPRTCRSLWPPHGTGILQGLKTTLLPEMKRLRQTRSAKILRDLDDIHTPEPKVQGCLTEIPLNSGSSAPPTSTPDGVKDGSTKQSSGALHNTALSTISRATRTGPELASSTEGHAKGSPTHRLPGQDHLSDEQENTAPSESTGQATPQRDWQDLFTSALFPEPNPPAYDARHQIRRGMQGHIHLSVGRGRGARTQHDQVVHPTLVDATVFQEYVQQLLTELDRAP